jgi:hypothetical protein
MCQSILDSSSWNVFKYHISRPFRARKLHFPSFQKHVLRYAHHSFPPNAIWMGDKWSVTTLLTVPPPNSVATTLTKYQTRTRRTRLSASTVFGLKISLRAFQVGTIQFVKVRFDLIEKTLLVVCGSRNPPESTIIKGTDVKKGDFPWQAAIYDSKTKKLICGGTVLSDRLILTGEFCKI